MIIGNLQFRARTEIANAEALQPMFDLGHCITEILPTGSATSVCRLRLRSWNHVTTTIDTLRHAQRRVEHGVDLAWASRERTLQESAKTGPSSRAVRLFKTHGEEHINVRIEGHYREGHEAVYIKFPETPHQTAIVARDANGVWRIDPVAFCQLGVNEMSAEEWLAWLL